MRPSGEEVGTQGNAIRDLRSDVCFVLGAVREVDQEISDRETATHLACPVGKARAVRCAAEHIRVEARNQRVRRRIAAIDRLKFCSIDEVLRGMAPLWHVGAAAFPRQ